MKYCPNCGKELPKGAQFCTNCGYHLADATVPKTPAHDTKVQSTEHPHIQESASHTTTVNNRNKQHKPHHWLGWLIAIVLLLVVGGFWFFGNQNNKNTTAPASSSSAEQSSTTGNVGTQSSSTGNESSAVSSNSTSGKLTTDIGPKNTAAAVTYYAAQNGVSHWKGVLNTTDGITVQLSTDDDLLNALSEPGQGMAYLVYGYHDVDSGDDTDFVYTIDKDNTVHIYTLPNDFDSDKTYDPEMTISKQDMVNYLNDHNDAGNVAKLSNKVDIDR